MQKFFCFLFTCLLASAIKIDAQIPTTWSIDSTQGVLSYENDAIYFKRPGGILKSDYYGNEIWARHFPFEINFISIDGNSIYCLDDSSVYRLDTAGVIIWARKFTSTICPGLTLPNTLMSITGNENRIYVFIYQFNAQSYQRHRSIVVLDSLGSIINVLCDINLTSLINYPYHSIKSQRSGAWLLQGYSTGPHIGCSLVKVDTLGYFDSNVVDGYQGNTATFGKMITLPDSNYFTFNNFYFDNIGQSVVCIKFDEQGTVLWKSTIQSTGQIQGLGYMAEINSATRDDSSNIYLSGWSLDNGDTNRNIVIKLDSSGNLVYAKAWIFPQSNFSDLFYHDGFIYMCGGKKIYDTSFFSPCYSPDTTIGIIYSGPSGQSGGATASFPVINYSLVIANPAPSNLLQSSLRLDLCTQDGIVDAGPEHSIIIFPNPTNDLLHIDIKQGSSSRYHLEIFNQIGEEVYADEFSSNSITLDCRQLHQGIYFIKIHGSEWRKVEKLIVK